MRCWSKGVLILLLCCSLLGCTTANVDAENGKQAEEPAPLRLEMQQERYTLADENLTWQIINETGEVYSMIFAPLLEQQQADGSWLKLDCEAGFCGVEDPVKELTEGYASMEWYSNLQPGVYRLSYNVTVDTEKKEVISAEFEIE